MDVRLGQLGVARGADRPDSIALDDRRALRDRERAEMRQRDGVPVGRRDREALARGRDGAGKGHRSGRGRDDGGAGVGADVDATMLARGVRVRGIEDERLQTGPSAGQLQAPAAGARTSAAATAASRTRRTDVCCMAHPFDRRRSSRETPPIGDGATRTCVPVHGRGGSRRCQTRLQSCHRVVPVEVVSGRVRQPCDDVGGDPAGRAGSDELGDRRAGGRAIVANSPQARGRASPRP